MNKLGGLQAQFLEIQKAGAAVKGRKPDLNSSLGGGLYFPKALYLVVTILHKYTRALTFESLCQTETAVAAAAAAATSVAIPTPMSSRLCRSKSLGSRAN
jgi:hypothetical protein